MWLQYGDRVAKPLGVTPLPSFASAVIAGETAEKPCQSLSLSLSLSLKAHLDDIYASDRVCTVDLLSKVEDWVGDVASEPTMHQTQVADWKRVQIVESTYICIYVRVEIRTHLYKSMASIRNNARMPNVGSCQSYNATGSGLGVITLYSASKFQTQSYENL